MLDQLGGIEFSGNLIEWIANEDDISELRKATKEAR